MQFVGKVITSVSEFYKDINPSTLSGAIDILVVEDVNTGRLSCSPFHVRFGKLQLLRPQEKIVEMRVNGQLTDVRMKVGEAGETFFVLPTRAAVSAEYLTSPLVTALSGTSSTVEPLQLSPRKENIRSGDPLGLPADSDDGDGDDDGGVKSEGETPRSAVVGEEILGGRRKYAHASAPLPPNDRAALSDSEVEATRSNTTTSNNHHNGGSRATVINGGHEQYSSWLWGGLPQRDATSKQVQSKEKTESTTTGQGSDRDRDRDRIQTLTPKGPALLEHLLRPSIIRKNYERLSERLVPPRDTTGKGKEEMSDSRPLIYRVPMMMDASSASSSTLLLSGWEDGSSLPTDLAPLLGEAIIWDGTIKALHELFSELCDTGADTDTDTDTATDTGTASSSSRQRGRLIISWYGCHFPGSTGLALILGRALFDRLPPLEDLLSSLASGEQGGDSRPTIRRASPSDPPSASVPAETIEGTTDSHASGIPVISTTTHVGVRANTNVNSNSNSNADPNGSTSATTATASATATTATTTASSSSTGRRSSWRWWSRTSTITTSGGDEPPLSPSRPEKDGGGGAGEGEGEATSGASGTATSPLTKALNVPLPPSPTTGPLASPSSYSSDEEANAVAATAAATTAGAAQQPEPEPTVYYTKSLRLPHEMLQQLNLQPGVNSISFTVSTRLQGTATCTARIFRWRSDTRIIISDIDGTITKSDALGHLFTFVGKDWTHANIARLYSSIARNGYRFIYLSSRSLGQANVTRGYLKGVEQNKFQLPDGPVIMSPDRLLAALRREVVLGIPQEFKIACLRDLQQLFYDCQPPGEEHANPFYAGFGNRTNDAAAYLAINIPPPRVFIINPAGTVSVEPLADRYASSYAQLIELVDSIFPPLVRAPMASEEPYNDFWYWRRPVSLAPLTCDAPPVRASNESAISIDYYGKVSSGGGGSSTNSLYALVSDNASHGSAAVPIGAMGGEVAATTEAGETLMTMMRGAEVAGGEEASQRRGAENGGRGSLAKGQAIGRRGRDGGEGQEGNEGGEEDEEEEEEEEEEEGLIPAYYA